MKTIIVKFIWRVFSLFIILPFCCFSAAAPLPFPKQDILLYLSFENARELDKYGAVLNNVTTEAGGITGMGAAFREKGEEITVPTETCFQAEEGSFLVWIKPLESLSTLPDSENPVFF